MCVMAISACEPDPYLAGVWMGPTGANVAKMVESEINYNGGAGGRRFKTRVVAQYFVSANELTPEMLAASLDSIARDTNVVAVVMRMTDSITEKATQEFERRGIPYLISTSVAENYAETHPHAFMLGPSVEAQAQFMVDEALSEGAPNVALVAVSEPHAEGLMRTIEQLLARRGVRPVFSTTFSQTADQINLQAKSKEISTHRPDVILRVGRSPSLRVMHPQIRLHRPNVRIVSSDLVESFYVYTNPQGIYTGVRFLRYMNPVSTDSVIRALRERMVLWIGRDELTNESVTAYDALKLVAEGLRSGATTRAAMYEF